MEKGETRVRYLLGLDVGANSVGWAAIELEDGTPTRLLRSGVRTFEAGVEGDFSTGKGTPRNADRRIARQRRRLLERRARRLRVLFNILQRAGLLPKGSPPEVLPDLDRTLQAKYLATGDLSQVDQQRLPHVLPYWLRARALDHPLQLHEIGRALYHLAQRRGFKSGRLVTADEEKELKGKVKPAINQLAADMASAGARTLGEYLSRLDPEQERFRARWTGRQMYLDEFEAIWSAQAMFHPETLTGELKREIQYAIFHQRPLKSSKGLVGPCELEPSRRRAPWALWSAQRYRLLQQVNHCKVITPDGEERPWTREERAALIEALESRGELRFADVKRLLKLSRPHHFTLEEGGEKRFVGNRTTAKLAEVFGERWSDLSARERDDIVEQILDIEDDDALARRAREAWGLDENAARSLPETQLEPGYCRLSRRALGKLLPFLEDGLAYAEAVKKAYGELHRRTQPLDRLPAVDITLPHLRNPVVQRALTEVRKVVNALIGEYGKPERIRVELARDMRRSKKQRQQIALRNRGNERKRKEAAEQILRETGNQNPSRDDIEKVLLAKECNCQCPYTGRTITMAALFGASPQFDVEHIIPFARSLDNSFLNKTLCYHEENRRVKRDHTPYEAYAHDPERWNEILSRVRDFRGNAAREKLRRFTMEDPPDMEKFTDQQLNDTRYAAKEARRYLSLLYGGFTDSEGTLRVQAVRGGTTYFLRSAWGLNAILGDGDLKTRDDHRHHAVDAVVVALTDPGAIKRFSEAAERAAAERRRLFGRIEEPWTGFLDSVRRSIEAINVSHRPTRRVRGALHKETFYGPPRPGPDGKPYVHLRKPLAKLTKDDIEKDRIVDPVIRERVREKLRELGGDLKAFKNPSNHPFLETKKGRRIPIHKVRVRLAENAFPVGDGARRRYVTTEGNHHVEIIEVRRGGRVRWEGVVVGRLEALRRLRRGKPVVRRDHGPDKRFLFSLAPGDMMEIDGEEGARRLVRVRSVSPMPSGTARIEFVDANDARLKTDIKKKGSGKWISRTPEKLRRMRARRVIVTPLGDVRRAND